MKLAPIEDSLTLKDHVYERLKAAIIEMDIYGAETSLRLDERSLADQLNISRTPLRAAIARLEADGLVQVVPRKGIFVVRKSLAEVLEMVIAWAALEAMAARLAAVSASDREIASLRTIASKYGDAVSETRIGEYSDDNIRFHLRILEISGNALLKTMAEGVLLHMHAVRQRTMGESDRIIASVADHAEIINALEARDAEAAARCVFEHTMSLHDHIERSWSRLELKRTAG